MSFAQIKDAVSLLSPAEMAELAELIEQRDKRAWDEEIEADFAPSGRLHHLLEVADRQIDAGDFTPLP